MGKIQKLDWGMIEWLYEPEEGFMDNMRVGISTMLPGTVQPRHIHCGDEQLMYVISGHGRQRIGEEESVLEKGCIYHISTGMAHESINDGEEPIVKLLISIPALTAVPKVRMNEAERVRKQESIDKQEFLRDTVKELFRSMLAPLKMPLAIFDSERKLVYKSKDYPEYCKNICRIDEDLENCPLIRKKNFWFPPYYEGASAYVCEHGLWVYALPIVADGEFLGYIKAGHVRTGERKGDETEEGLPYNVPDSTVTGIVQIIHKLSEAICNHYQLCQMQVALQHNVRVLSDRKKEEEMLQESLKTTQDQAFNLQINQHFLFNTLNTIAGLAVKEEAMQTYQAVGDLSQLLRYTLRTSSYFVTLGEEIEYLKNYTNLQRLRFGKRLEVEYMISSLLLQEKVPFNFLQPVAENSFKHGFKNKKGKMKLSVRAEREENRIKLTVIDNGEGIEAETLKALREKIENGCAEHGTAMVVRKLESLYGGSFGYQVDSSEEGTAVVIYIPIEERRNADETGFTG
ncbi:histidine kinase [Lacrimispora sp. NSJ-141]|uniref:Histidine kinase n=1 Tax=Lientehia hominis TaxID=2897778 RepID=A0AAP2W934_9FIRM|nr:histidine kinase [Lientehia hominis]MCD2491274.1 histidine kinase [Lientehia hominis]